MDSSGRIVQRVNVELLDQLVIAASPQVDDLDVAAPLLALLHDEFRAFGTSGGQWVPEDDIRMASDACSEVMNRLGLVTFDLPFRDYDGFYTFWRQKGAAGAGGWQARRDLLSNIFDPAHDAVRRERMRRRRVTIASGVTPAANLGWPAVDRLVVQIGRRFASARTNDDYKSVGLDCVSLLDTLSRTLYDPATHLRQGEEEPPVDQSKKRLERVVEDATLGASNDDLRKLIKSAIAYAHHVKHQTSPNRQQAGMAADATVLVAHLLRRLLGPDAVRSD
jgi:hypothetical protein